MNTINIRYIYGYDAYMILADAINQIDTFYYDSLTSMMSTMDIDFTVSGIHGFYEFGDPIKDIIFIEYNDGNESIYKVSQPNW
ncbi:MAG: hypothetical protein AB7E09_04145 [Candidatus Izemoplasmatales bacterium]